MALTETEEYTCTLTASGWQLYSFDGYENLSRAKRRGKSLSKRLTKLVRKAKAKLAANPLLSDHKLAEQVRDKMHKLMEKYADDGARDSEPQCVLVNELEIAFNLDHYSLDRW